MSPINTNTHYLLLKLIGLGFMASLPGVWFAGVILFAIRFAQMELSRLNGRCPWCGTRHED